MTYLGENIGKLGFGLMRLPMNGKDINIEITKKMVVRFMEEGFTYFDTAWAYPGSEDAIRQALVERYPRDSFQLATKNAAWINCKTREEAIGQFELSLKQTGAGYFDFYLLHNLGEGRTKFFDDFDMWSFVQEKKEEGLIKHVGFSFHSTAKELEEILDAHPETEFVQLQINYGDWESHAIQSRKCYEVVRKRNIPVVIMEPVKGGMLATPPPSVEAVFKEYDSNSTNAEWALKFCADLEGVITVLSGMSNLEQMEENLRTFKNFDGLTNDERYVLDRAREEMEKVDLIPCTVCNYCAKVCPIGVGISGTMTALNLYTLYGDKEAAKGQESWLVAGHGLKSAGECIKCGACEKACPQHIGIISELEKGAETFYA